MDEDGCELDDDFMSQSWLGCNTPEFSSILILSPRIFQQLANSFKGGHVDGNSVVKRAFHGVVTGWVTSWEVSPVRREVLHQPYLVRTLPPGPQRYQAGVPARDWGGGRCQSGVQASPIPLQKLRSRPTAPDQLLGGPLSPE